MLFCNLKQHVSSVSKDLELFVSWTFGREWVLFVNVMLNPKLGKVSENSEVPQVKFIQAEAFPA